MTVVHDLMLGIIGFGARASMAREADRPGRGSRIAAVFDPSPRARDDAAQAFPDATITDDLEQLLNSGLDAVMIFTPDDLHAPLAIRALEAGMAVFCEKPMATDLESADRMLQVARLTGSRLYIGHNMRHMPVVALLRRLVAEGRIGRVRTIWCRHFVGNGGDYYFKDWHADRSRTTGLLLQKGAHDIDIIHWLGGAYTERVSGMGELSVYGDVEDRRDRRGERMPDWFSLDNWPPAAMTGLNPVVDVEDVSMVHMRLTNGVLASYEQCHFTPDYWRNYTVIGDEGRLENFGDSSGGTVGLWNRRHAGYAPPDEVFEIGAESTGDHDGADALLVAEFLRFVRDGGATETSAVAAREAVATAALATESLRTGGAALRVTPLPADLVAYYDAGQRE